MTPQELYRAEKEAAIQRGANVILEARRRLEAVTELRRVPKLKDCLMPDCRRVAHTRGLCLLHYQHQHKAAKRARSA